MKIRLSAILSWATAQCYFEFDFRVPQFLQQESRELHASLEASEVSRSKELCNVSLSHCHLWKKNKRNLYTKAFCLNQSQYSHFRPNPPLTRASGKTSIDLRLRLTFLL